MENTKEQANDLIQLSNYTYKLIQELIDYRYRLLNPMLVSFLTEEKKFFDACSNFCRKFDNISMKVNELDRVFQKTPIQYDPFVKPIDDPFTKPSSGLAQSFIPRISQLIPLVLIILIQHLNY